jgi:hypothetical protein
MVVNFLKGNHLGVATATLPWLCQAEGSACMRTIGALRMSQGGLQPQSSIEKEGPSPGDPGSSCQVQRLVSQGQGVSLEVAQRHVSVSGSRTGGRREESGNDSSGTGGTGQDGCWQGQRHWRQQRRQQWRPSAGQGRQRLSVYHLFLVTLELSGLAAAGLALIRVQRPLREATRLWGRKRLAIFWFFLKDTNAQSCVQQVCCKFGSVTAALLLNCQVRGWMHLVFFLTKGRMRWFASVEPGELSSGSRNAAGRRFFGHYRCLAGWCNVGQVLIKNK